MSSIIVKSRFACLPIDDDTESSKENVNKKKSNKPVKKNGVNLTRKGQQTTKQQSSATRKKKGKQVSEQQWETWKQKDADFVDDNFQNDMQKALMESKLDYEAQKQLCDSESKNNTQGNKKKKNKPMSLDQFLNPVSETNGEKKETENLHTDGEDFFIKMTKDAKQELNKEKANERQKKRNENIEEIITASQYQSRLKEEMAKNAALVKELDLLKNEMELVKSRNTTLCAMLSEGEMKDKADVLKELDRVNKLRKELTDEVENLHTLLEQERSKTVLPNNNDSKQRNDKKSKKR